MGGESVIKQILRLFIVQNVSPVPSALHPTNRNVDGKIITEERNELNNDEEEASR